MVRRSSPPNGGRGTRSALTLGYQHAPSLRARPSTVAASPSPAELSRTDAPPGLEPRSRREALLSAALRLFASRTYASVGIEDIVAAAGMAGASVYSHFSSKQEILVTALDRGSAALAMDAASALASSSAPVDALRLFVERYAHFALRHHELVDVLVIELRNVEEPARTSVLGAQHAYITEWTHLLMQVHGDLSPPAARAQVHAALMLINAVARSDRLRSASNAHEALCVLARRVLFI